MRAFSHQEIKPYSCKASITASSLVLRFEISGLLNNFELLKQKGTGPFHTTIKKFKGLEYNIVVLLDIKQEHFSTKKALVNEVYTGFTRSLETTCIFFNSETKEYLLGSS